MVISAPVWFQCFPAIVNKKSRIYDIYELFLISDVLTTSGRGPDTRPGEGATDHMTDPTPPRHLSLLIAIAS